MRNTELLTKDVDSLYRKYLVPAIGGSLAVSVYSLVDTIAVGRYAGPAGSAAIAVINPLFAIVIFFGMMVGIGSAVMMGRAKGEGRMEKADGFFSVAMILSLIFSALSYLILFSNLDGLLAFCGADGTILPYARDYAFIFSLFAPTFILTNCLSSIVRYDERPRLVLAATLVGGVFNVVGDYVFVFPMDMGLTGAALATVLGNTIQLCILFSHFFSGRSTLRFSLCRGFFKAAGKILSSGFGASILDVAIGVLTVIINKQTMRYGGPVALAVLGVIMTISFVLQHVFAGIGQAIQPIVSTNYGAFQEGRIERCFVLMIRSSVVFGIVSFLLCFLVPVPMLRLFMTVTDEVLTEGPHIIRLYSISFILMALNINMVFFVQSIMKSVAAMLLSLSRGLIVSAFLLYVLPVFFALDGVLFAMTAAEVVTFAIGAVYLAGISRSGGFIDRK